MGFYIKPDGSYYEGDNQGGDQEVPQRLSPTSRWNGKNWIETTFLFEGIPVKQKADVDAITAQAIANLGEQKAKTEKLLAGSGECPIWDDFIRTRAVILKQGTDFIVTNKLT